MQIPVDTSNGYFALGYVVIAILLIAIIGTLIIRSRRLHRDYLTLMAEDSHDIAMDQTPD